MQTSSYQSYRAREVYYYRASLPFTLTYTLTLTILVSRGQYRNDKCMLTLLKWLRQTLLFSLPVCLHNNTVLTST